VSEPLRYRDYVFPRDRKYSEKHVWVKVLEANRVRIGITDYAQKKLKSIVFIEAPQVGSQVEEGELLTTIESIKAIGEVYAPLRGRISAYNEKLDDDPGILNRDPYGEGWIVEMEVEDTSSVEKLMKAEEYVERVVKREE